MKRQKVHQEYFDGHGPWSMVLISHIMKRSSLIEMFAGSMLSNSLEFRDDAGNEIAFFEKKKKKCSQSVAMVSNLHFHTIKDFETVN